MRCKRVFHIYLNNSNKYFKCFLNKYFKRSSITIVYSVKNFKPPHEDSGESKEAGNRFKYSNVLIYVCAW